MAIRLKDAGQTLEVGRRLGRAALPGDVLLIEGPLGAGKTVLVQGLAEGLDCDGEATSPTFVLVRQHEGRLPLVHADLYRLENVAEVRALGLLELAESGVLAVEWPERDRGLGVDGATRLRITQGTAGEDARTLHVESAPAHLLAVLDEAAP
ncbi:MAG: tRNA (adenosine(37)-N6)-threonylcarbamoyltransferase complex ATPase subunit type 1 TsaE [Candidatus Dormibacteria bacterium]